MEEFTYALNKNQSRNHGSETKDTISDDSDDVSESLSPPAEGNRKYITGTNTPRASRSNAYYELLCNQQTNGYRSPAMRGTTAAAHGITSASGLVSYQEDFATDAAQDLGVHGAAAELIMQETFLGTAAEDVGILGSYAVKGIKDISLQNQAIYPSLFATHGRGLPLGNALGTFRHKQDSTLVAEQATIFSTSGFLRVNI